MKTTVHQLLPMCRFLHLFPVHAAVSALLSFQLSLRRAQGPLHTVLEIAAGFRQHDRNVQAADGLPAGPAAVPCSSGASRQAVSSLDITVMLSETGSMTVMSKLLTSSLLLPL